MHAPRQADAEEIVAQASATTAGDSLPEPLQRKFEASLGADLSSVRVHTDDTSHQAATAVGAQAYTIGDDIHFRAGHFDPGSSAGEELLAHEVAHTVQQAGGASRRPMFKLDVSSPGDAHELEADAAAARMVQGQPFALRASPPSFSLRALHRKGAPGLVEETNWLSASPAATLDPKNLALNPFAGGEAVFHKWDDQYADPGLAGYKASFQGSWDALKTSWNAVVPLVHGYLDSANDPSIAGLDKGMQPQGDEDMGSLVDMQQVGPNGSMQAGSLFKDDKAIAEKDSNKLFEKTHPGGGHDDALVKLATPIAALDAQVEEKRKAMSSALLQGQGFTAGARAAAARLEAFKEQKKADETKDKIDTATAKQAADEAKAKEAAAAAKEKTEALCGLFESGCEMAAGVPEMVGENPVGGAADVIKGGIGLIKNLDTLQDMDIHPDEDKKQKDIDRLSKELRACKMSVSVHAEKALYADFDKETNLLLAAGEAYSGAVAGLRSLIVQRKQAYKDYAQAAAKVVGGPEGTKIGASLEAIPLVEAIVGRITDILTTAQVPAYSPESGKGFSLVVDKSYFEQQVSLLQGVRQMFQPLATKWLTRLNSLRKLGSMSAGLDQV